MTVLLKDAFNRASALPEELQNELAEELIADIEAESRWDKTFKDTEDKLAKMADTTRFSGSGLGHTKNITK